MGPIRKFVVGLMIGVFLFSLQKSGAQINTWTNPASGYWEDQSWSLGALPGANQSVFITNSGYKAVAVFPSTVSGYPATLTVSNLTVSAPNNSLSTLLLNYVGTSVPLHVLGGCDVGTNGTLINEFSALQVDGQSGGLFSMSGGSFVQEGGTLNVSNDTHVSGGTLRLTNATAAFSTVYVEYGSGTTGLVTQVGGVVNGGFRITGGSEYQMLGGSLTGGVTAGWNGNGTVSQHGGTNFGNVVLGTSDFHSFAGGEYFLYGGSVINSGISIAQSSGYPSGNFNQLGGYVQTGSLNLGWNGFTHGSYTIANGTLIVGSMSLWNSSFHQGGGVVTFNSGVNVSGSFDDYDAEYRTSSSFGLSGGLLTMPDLRLGLFGGFIQSGGTNSVGSISIDRTIYGLSAGVLNVSNVFITGGYLVLSDGSYRTVGEINQSGGSNYVANLLSVGDEYQLSGGSLFASNILVTGTMTVGGGMPTLTNPGTFTLEGTLQLLGTTQSFGRLTLSNNSTIDFWTNASTVVFPPSSNLPWAAGSVLGITNWQGNTNGGGNDRLYIGNSNQGVTPSQLWQIEFRNPGGLAPGTYAATILSTGEIVPTKQVNSWTNFASGSWENNFWSLGLLPAGNQFVFLTNGGYKAVGVFPSTAANFPNALTVRSLDVSAPNDAATTLLLNYAGTSVPLKVLDGFALATNGTLLNYYSAFEVNGTSGGSFIIDGGTYAQEGGTLIDRTINSFKAGSINLTNATATFRNITAGGYYPGSAPQIVQSGGSVAGVFQIQNGSYELLSGSLSGSMTLGHAGTGTMDQFGGTNSAGVQLAERTYYTGPISAGIYRLYGGTLKSYELEIADDYECSGEFDLYGGEVDVNLIQIGPNYGPLSASLTVSNGVLSTRDINVGNVNIRQAGGVVNITRPLNFYGFYDTNSPQYSRSPNYSLEGGILNVGGLIVYGYSWFTQRGGTNNIAGDLVITTATYNLAGGSLSASNIVVDGGLLTITNGGTANNSGVFVLGGTLQVQNATQNLGALAATNKALLDVSTGASTVTFRARSGSAWALGSQLVVTNWHGNTNGGGLSRLIVGTSGSGLSSGQLSQLEFINPAGFAPGTYGSRILATGEVVPTQSAFLSLNRTAQNLIVTWPGALVLQTATNVAGPYLDLPTATSPFTNPASEAPQQFFRLRR